MKQSLMPRQQPKAGESAVGLRSDRRGSIAVEGALVLALFFLPLLVATADSLLAW